MYELHENEQYFFAEPTLAHLAGFLARFAAPCCLCAPLLGRRLAEQGVAVTILDIDERFAAVRGFRCYNLYNPESFRGSPKRESLTHNDTFSPTCLLPIIPSAL